MNYRDVILLLNKAKISNRKIIYLIENNQLDIFINNSYNINEIDQLLTIKEKNRLMDIKDIELYKYELYKKDIKYKTILDRDYPRLLKEIPDPPALIYYKGNWIDKGVNISFVGSRKPSSYGEIVTKKIIKDLSRKKINIVSGMAIGIDRYAHQAAIDNKMKTIGVLASSLDIIYPRINIDLYNQMYDNHLLISEFPLSTPAYKLNFVRRNRIISGLSYGTVVIEAKEKSGSLITAKYAAEQDREVFSVPGNITNINSKGSNMLIDRGAKLLMSADDIFKEIIALSNFPDEKKIVKNNYKFNKEELLVLECIKNDYNSVNQILNQTKLQVGQVYSILTLLELRGIITFIDNQKYTIR